MMFIIWFWASPAIAAEEHWAKTQIEEMKAKGICFFQEPDAPASLSLQKEVFGLTGISLQPREALNRYSLIQSMLININSEDVNDADIQRLLKEYADYCDY
ncbi:MAG: hypothetical protein NUV48_15520 [Peptococcaceae bacterium]|nr:hypothetical protein [Peptococcaceae bacterium]